MSEFEAAQRLAMSAMSLVSTAGAKAITSGGRREGSASPGEAELVPLLGRAGERRARTADAHSSLIDVCKPWVDLISLSTSSGEDGMGIQSQGNLGSQIESMGSPWGYLLDGIGIPPLKPAPSANPNQGPQSNPQTANNPDPLHVAQGQFTFDAEGTEGGQYHTRRIHMPGGNSGVTIGRGYDLGQHTAEEVRRDLNLAGFSPDLIERLIPFATAKGLVAEVFYNMYSGCLPEITLEQQNKLFQITYQQLTNDVRRISEKDDVVAEYGGFEWDKLDPAIRELVVDLRYRGDYTPETRELVQPFIVKGDLAGLIEVMSDKKRWGSVPQDRFNRRVAYLDHALQKKPAAPLQSPGSTQAHDQSPQPTTKAKSASTPTTVSNPPPRPLNDRK